MKPFVGCWAHGKSSVYVSSFHHYLGLGSTVGCGWELAAWGEGENTIERGLTVRQALCHLSEF